MLRFEYGNIVTRIVSGTEAERAKVLSLLTIYEKKEDNMFSFLRRDNSFLTGLLDRVMTGLLAGGVDFVVDGAPVLEDIVSINVRPDILSGISLYSEYQEPAVRKALWKKRGTIEIPTGAGKCLAPETPVLHYNGEITRADEIRVGDLLMGPDSTPRRVTSTSSGFGPMVMVVPVKGNPWRCNDIHVLTMVHTQTGEILDIPVSEYELKSKTFKHCHKLFQPAGVDFGVEHGKFKIPPYFLGVWFGDGRRSLQVVEVSKPDVEIENVCREVAELYGLSVVVDGEKHGRCKVYRIVGRSGVSNPLLNDLRVLVGDSERLPRAYLLASRDDRKALLAGLLDTDGYFHDGFFEICQKRVGLADDIAFLARSLGFRVTQREKKVEIEPGRFVVYQRLGIIGDVTSLPLRIKRKTPLSRRQVKDPLRTGFKIVQDGVGEYCGITLDGDGRFLLGDFTVTHNTEIAAAILRHLEEDQGISTIMVVPGINSMHQAWRRWRLRGIESVGRYGDGKKELNGTHLIAVVDSLRTDLRKKNKKLISFLDNVGCILFMEAQHVPSDTWTEIGLQLDVPYRLGLSATPYEDDGTPTVVRDLHLVGITGETVVKVPDSVVMNLGRMATPNIHYLAAGSEWLGKETDWNRVRRVGLVANEARNSMIKDMAARLATAGRKVLVLATEIAHMRALAGGISGRCSVPVFTFQGGSVFTAFRGGVGQVPEKKPIYDVAEQLEEILGGYVLVGSPAVDEDADFPDADVLIICSAGRSFKKIVQRVGRVLRAKAAPNLAHIIDFQDRGSFVLKAQSNRRREMCRNRYQGANRFQIVDHEHIDTVIQAVVSQ